MVLLYEGRQIFFGGVKTAKVFFTEMGFICPERASTADFLTSLTNPVERIVKQGFELKVPRTSDEFASIWQNSSERASLRKEIHDYNTTYPTTSEQETAFRQAHKSNMAVQM